MNPSFFNNVAGPILLGGAFGGCISSIVFWGKNNSRIWIALGVLLFAWVGFWVAEWFLDKLARWDSFSNGMAFDSVSKFQLNSRPVTEGTVINIHLPEGGTVRLSTGLEEEDWSRLSWAVLETGNFTLASCKLAFGDAEGPNVYQLIRERLKDAKVIVDYGNGYKLNGDRGSYFFEQLKKGSMSPLNLLRELD